MNKIKIDILDSRINNKYQTIYKCPSCNCYHLLWKDKICKYNKQEIEW
jgi:hypothetical protein